MKVRNLFFAVLASAAVLVGCQEKEQDSPSITLNPAELNFTLGGDLTATMTVNSTRDWRVAEKPEWVEVTPAEGTAGKEAVVTVKVTENTGANRTGNVKFVAGVVDKTLVVNQEGQGGDPTERIVYFNNFDKEVATQTYGTDSKYWPYLDQFEGWKNEQGSGVGNVAYEFSGASARANSTPKPEYGFSGNNNIMISKNAGSYLRIKDVVLPSETVNYQLSFGCWKYSGANISNEYLKVYVSNDAAKWVELKWTSGDVAEDQWWKPVSYAFTVPANTAKLYIHFANNDSSNDVRLEDVKLESTETAGESIDFSTGVDLGGGSTPEPGEFEVVPISNILSLSTGDKVAANTGIEGVVISNSDLNNLTSKKGAYIQDATGGLQLRFSENHEFKFGDKVKINLSGIAKGEYQGAVQISVANANATLVSSGEKVEPKTVSAADFLDNKYEGQYVAIENVQIVNEDLTKTWVVGNAHTNINVEDNTGKSFIVFSSSYSSFGAQTVPQGAGTLKGIASINVREGVTAMQLIFAQESDFAGLTGERFGAAPAPSFGVSSTSVNVDANSESAIFKVSGNVEWTANVTSGDFVTILSGNSGNGAGDVVLQLTKNESEESRTAKVTVSTTADVATKSYEVVLTQAGKTTEPEPGEAYYVKVTETPADWSGQYLIVYEDGSLAFDGSLANPDAVNDYKQVSITDNRINASSEMDAISFTIASKTDGYSIKTASGMYIGKTADSNGMDKASDDKYVNTVSLNEDGSCQITGSGKAVLRFNSAKDQMRFRYYKSISYTGQKAIVLYKRSK